MRVLLPDAPDQVALTPAPATLKMVLSVPLVKPFTLSSKLTVKVMVSPALLPAVPASVLSAVLGAVLLRVGASVSMRMAGVVPAPPLLPAVSV